MSNARLAPLAKVHDLDPNWPFSVWSTGALVRQGRLGCVRVGRRIFLTLDHLERFVREHDDGASATQKTDSGRRRATQRSR